MDSTTRGAFRARLLRWYDRHRRELPWRATRDPYRVWVSEIMLQQTRVSAVLDHYQKFMQRFPTLEKLAAAREASVLAAWSGLGYYRRARALHAAARQIARGGGFPRSAGELRTLPGIGRYTAAAIASIAFDEPCAVVDGNVERVLRRLLGAANVRTQEDTWRRAQELLSRERPGDFNQAMMELGATLCLPGTPLCQRCPVFRWCATRGALPATAGQRRQKQRIAYHLAARPGAVFLAQRGADLALMPGMWELPPARHGGDRPLLRLRHSITTTDYVVDVVPGRAPRNGAAGRWVPLARISRLPLTGLTRKILRLSRII